MLSSILFALEIGLMTLVPMSSFEVDPDIYLDASATYQINEVVSFSVDGNVIVDLDTTEKSNLGFGVAPTLSISGESASLVVSYIVQAVPAQLDNLVPESYIKAGIKLNF